MNLREIMSTLRSQRVSKGWSVLETANRLGISENTLFDWELARKRPSVERLLEYSALMGQTVTVGAPLVDASPIEPRPAEDLDTRAERLLTDVLNIALDVRDSDLSVTHRRLQGTSHSDLVAMVVLAAACIPVEESRQALLAWWDGQGLRLSDLVSTCPSCHDHFVQAPDGQARLYCSTTCRELAQKERRNKRAQAFRELAA